jgi:hypothetical protein
MNYDAIRNKFYENGGYAEVPEMVSNDILIILKAMNRMIIKNGYLRQEDPKFIEDARGKHGLQISELLLLYFKHHYSLILGKNLIPTYSYTRIYKMDSGLPKHTDRPSCQYSITLNIGASSPEPWPFFCQAKTPGAIESKIYNKLYSPIIYMGEEVTHWRDKLEKEHSTHVFLHYVDGDDEKYRPYWYDKRKFIGQ